jgi:hypothetical protein
MDREGCRDAEGTAGEAPPAWSRRRLLLGWSLMAGAAAGLAACSTPRYDPDRGLFVMRPKK